MPCWQAEVALPQGRKAKAAGSRVLRVIGGRVVRAFGRALDRVLDSPVVDRALDIAVGNWFDRPLDNWLDRSNAAKPRRRRRYLDAEGREIPPPTSDDKA
jgi:hypothetical protein